jgi:hypothetical protein
MTRDRSRDLAPWRLGAVVQEVVAHAALLAVAWFSGLGYIGTVLVLALELVLVNLLSTVVFPERGVLKHLRDLLLFVPLVAFLLMFVLLTYGAAMESELEGAAADGPFGLLRFDAELLRWTATFTAVHLGAMLAYALTRPQPRLAWARMALMQSAVTFIAIFLLVFAAVFLGPFAIRGARVLWPDTPGDHVLSALAVLIRFAIALVMSRMPEDEIEKIARDPYVS